MHTKTFKNRLLLVFLVVLSLTSTPLYSQTQAEKLTQKANDYFWGTNGVYMNKEQAFKLWLQAAKLGNPEAQYRTAERNVNISAKERLVWVRKSVEQGYAPAMYILSLYYQDGLLGLQQDYHQARYWAKTSADKGYPDAMRVYAYWCFAGVDRAANVKEGLKYYEEVTNKLFDDYNSNYRLKNADESTCERIIYNYDLKYLITTLCDLYDKGEVNLDFSGTEDTIFTCKIQTNKDGDKWAYWVPRGAVVGIPECQFQYGLAYFDEPDNTEEEKKGIEWIKKAGDQGHETACLLLTKLYYGQFTDRQNYKNISLAIEWARKGTKLKVPECCWLLSELSTEDGSGIDTAERIAALECAADQGYENAIADLVVLYSLTGYPKKVNVTGEDLGRLLDKGNARALANAGMWGLVNKKMNKTIAKEYVRRAARAGDRFGKELAKIYKIKY